MNEENKDINEQLDDQVQEGYSDSIAASQAYVVEAGQGVSATVIIDDTIKDEDSVNTNKKGLFALLWAKMVWLIIFVKNKIVSGVKFIFGKIKGLFKSKKNNQNTDNLENGIKVAKEKTPEEIAAIRQKRKENVKLAWKNTCSFVSKKIFTKKILNLVLILLSLAIVIFGAIQVGLISYGVANNFDLILSLFKEKDIIGIISLVIVVIAIVTTLAQIVVSLIAIISKKKQFNLTILSTLIGFYIVTLFFKNEISALLFENIGFEFKLIKIITVLSFIYALAQLLNGNFKNTIFSIICASLCATIAVLLYSKGVINFVEFVNVDESVTSLKELNLYEYVDSAIKFMENILEVSGVEVTLLSMVLTFVILFIAKVFPYMCLSIIGYAVVVFAASTGRQIYTMRFLKRIAISLLVFVILMGGCIAILYFMNIYTALTLNIQYIIYLLLGLIAIIIFAQLPTWCIEKVNNKRAVKFY